MLRRSFVWPFSSPVSSLFPTRFSTRNVHAAMASTIILGQFLGLSLIPHTPTAEAAAHRPPKASKQSPQTSATQQRTIEAFHHFKEKYNGLNRDDLLNLYAVLDTDFVDPTEKGMVMVFLSNYARFSGQYAQANAMYEKTLEYYFETGQSNPILHAYVLLFWGELYSEMDDRETATQLYNEAELILNDYPEDSIHDESFRLHLYRGQNYMESGNFKLADADLTHALRLVETHHPNRPVSIAWAKERLCRLHIKTKTYEKAKSCLTELNTLFKNENELSGELLSLVQLEVLARKQHQPAKALRYQKQMEYVLDKKTKTLDEKNQKLSLLSEKYKYWGEWQRVIDLYTQALVFYEQNNPDGETRNIAMSYATLGSYYDKLGQYKNAAEASEKALDYMRNNQNPYLANTLHNTAYYYIKQGEPEKAIPFIQEALHTREQVFGKTHPDIALSHQLLGQAYKALGQLDKAYTHYQHAASVFEEAGIDYQYDTTLNQLTLGHLAREQGNTSEAITHYQTIVTYYNNFFNAYRQAAQNKPSDETGNLPDETSAPQALFHTGELINYHSAALFLAKLQLERDHDIHATAKAYRQLTDNSKTYLENYPPKVISNDYPSDFMLNSHRYNLFWKIFTDYECEQIYKLVIARAIEDDNQHEIPFFQEFFAHLDRTHQDAKRLNLLRQLAERYRHYNGEQHESYYMRLFEIASLQKQMGQDYNSIEKTLETCIAFAKADKGLVDPFLYKELAEVHTLNQKPKDAIALYLKVVPILQENKQYKLSEKFLELELGHIYFNLAQNYRILKDYDKARPYFIDSIALMKKYQQTFTSQFQEAYDAMEQEAQATQSHASN